MEVGLEVIRYILPAIIVLIITYIMLSMFMGNEEKRRMYEVKLDSRRNSLPIRLQAYERLALFLERIQPANLMVRIKSNRMNVAGYQAILLQTIRSEYEYNLSQQIYVSTNAWSMIKGAKDATVNLINQAAKNLNPDASAEDLRSLVLQILAAKEHSPSDRALEFIKNEVTDEL
ncbi:hypothetical protein HZ996_06525 [Cryomorphaceae bacterium]|nr:hypothetical protein HZ996_06525 [Cryomorphaceae bacterium]